MEKKIQIAVEKNKQGIKYGEAGDYQKAIQCFEDSKKIYSKLPDTYYFLGLAYQHLRDLQRAVTYYKKAVEIFPRYAIAYNNLGVCYLDMDKYESAKINLTKAIEIDPNHALAYTNLGNVFRTQGNKTLAKKQYEKALSIDPNIPAAYNNLGTIYFSEGDNKKASEMFMKAIELNPGYLDAYYHLGVVYRKSGDYKRAEKYLLKSIALNPKDEKSYVVLGTIYQRLGNYKKAMKCFETAIEINPNSADCYNDLGNLFNDNNETKKALEAYKKAVRIDPNFAGAQNNLGITLINLEQYTSGIGHLTKATKLIPDYADAFYHLGLTYTHMGELEKAARNFNQALKVNPNYTDTINSHTYLSMKMCDWASYKRMVKKLDILTRKQLKEGVRTSEAPFLSVIRNPNPKENLKVAKSWNKFIKGKVEESKIEYKHDKSSKKKIRIGYLSNDFFDHATSHLIRGLYEKHNKKKFEIYTYSYGPRVKSKYLYEIKKYSDKFIDISEIGNIEAANTIYKDDIEILVDLKGHTKDNRLEICALKPAPIQITYLGFPGSTGTDFFDYMITDRVVTPKEHVKYYTEKLIFLPNSYQVNDNKEVISKRKYIRKDFGLPEKAFIYSCFNHNYKIDEETFKSWVSILKATSPSVLLLLKSNKYSKKNILSSAKKMGINPKRIIFADKLKKADHLRRIQLSSLALDTFICNGHTTTSDALWAGVPVVTLCGKHFASRVSGSLLTAIKLPNLITKTSNEYEKLAISLAKNPKKLKDLIAKLNKNRLTTPLFDTNEFTKNIETLYSNVWKKHNG